MKRQFLQLRVLFLATILCSCQSSFPTRSNLEQDKFERLESSISPFVVFSKQQQKFSIAERMRHYRVPALMLAIVHRGEIIFSKAYGVKDVQSLERIDTNTIFQAASVSKPITAIGALTLVDDGRLSLDGDINLVLKSWRLPDSSFTTKERVTLRRILSHTAGLTVGGFLGYRIDEKIPEAKDVLAGRGNSEPVIVDTIPGTKTRYSGGGTVIAQVMIEDASGEPFADFMKHRVLEPLSMKNSFYAGKLPQALQARAAAGHTSDGNMVRGRHHIYPELGPAGLWTTAEDLAKVVVGLQKSYLGLDSKFPLPRDTVKQMLTLQGERFGLGPRIENKGNILIFDHNGSNVGYKAMWLGFVDESAKDISHSGGFVALSNGDGGFHVMEEIASAIGETMGWQFLIKERREISFKPLTQEEQAMVGIFDKSGEEIFITENDGILNFWGHEIYKIDDFTFISGQGHHNIFKLSKDKNTLEVDVTFDTQKEFLVLKRK